ncbi:MAG: ABC transporter substrate-binding protein [Bacteroidota bacterium]|nr:ABC transporter substrate-binding protein [Rhodothermia bacterium]MCS7154844.1 ABC transporter substrate-binding protein [Bacteroidota bacterium]MDW8137638.1 ABC transporter substrate-binding protein [Bacteroidota bacterium]MDW8285408.1 ABC transporter substrate-binding protein [Bacteroidota bacterium]
MRAQPLVALCLVGALAWPVAAQTDAAAPESLFVRALEEFRLGRYPEAFGRFEALYRQGSHPRTTAAGLMAGRALVALRQYRPAAQWLEAFVRAHPGSRYAPEALWSLGYTYWALHEEGRALEALFRAWQLAEDGLRAQSEERFWALCAVLGVRELDSIAAQASDPVLGAALRLAAAQREANSLRFEEALRRLEALRPPPNALRERYAELEAALKMRRLLPSEDAVPSAPYRVGVLLPIGRGRDPDRRYSRELLAGLRLAVEEHNRARPDRPIQLLFRDAASPEGTIQSALQELLGPESVDLVVGPLYSREAAEVVDVAEEARVPLVLPLANEEQLVDERQWVFQVNPPASAHARAMARFAAERLRLRRVAVLFRPSEREAWLADVFATEFEASGGTIVLRQPLSASRQRVTAGLVEQLRAVAPEALYIALAGEDTENAIENILGRFDELGYRPPRILGGPAWHELRSSWSRLALFRVTYTAEGLPEARGPAYTAFRSAFRARFGEEPGPLALTGYDLGKWLAQALAARAPAEPVRAVLVRTGPFRGMRLALDFRYGNINSLVQVLQYQGGRIVEAEGL